MARKRNRHEIKFHLQKLKKIQKNFETQNNFKLIQNLVKIEKQINNSISGNKKKYIDYFNVHPQERPPDFFQIGDFVLFNTNGKKLKARVIDVKPSNVLILGIKHWDEWKINKSVNGKKGINISPTSAKLQLESTKKPRKPVKLKKPKLLAFKEKPTQQIVKLKNPKGESVMFQIQLLANGREEYAIVEPRSANRTHYSRITNPKRIYELWRTYRRLIPGLKGESEKTYRLALNLNRLFKHLNPYQKRIIKKLDKEWKRINP